MISALSYPHMAPPIDWLMVQLLFYDEIKTIVPKSEFCNLPQKHLSLYEIVKDAVSFIDTENEGIYGSISETDRIINGLEVIRNKTDFNNKNINFNSNSSIEGCSLIHSSKIDDRIMHSLNTLNLLPENSYEIAYKLNHKYWFFVEKNAADLIIGHLSNKLSKRHGCFPITYDKTPFILNSINDINTIPNTPPKSMIATKILNFEFPYEISNMSLKDYKILRDAYSDIRISFHSYVNDLTQICYLDTFSDLNTLTERINDISDDFHKEYEEFRRTEYIRHIIKWVPFSITSLLCLLNCIPSINSYTLPLTFGSIAIQFLEKCHSDNFLNNNNILYNRLSKLEQAIIEKANIQDFL